MGLLSASITLHRKSIMDNPVVFNEKVFKIVNDSFEVAEISDLPGVVSSLNNAGIIVAKDTIYLKAKQTKVLNKNNQDIAVFNDDGSFNANLINAKQIVADGLKANTFDAGNATINNLIVTNAQVTGKITATSGKIGVFLISPDGYKDSLMSGTWSDDRNPDVSRFTTRMQLSKNLFEMIYKSNPNLGDDVVSDSDLCRVSISMGTKYSSKVNPVYIKAYSLLSETAALVIDTQGSIGSHALWIENGNIAGLRLNSNVVDENYTLNDYDNVIILNTGTTTKTIYLPSSPQEGQIYFIVQNGSASYDLYSSGGYKLYGSGNDGGSTKINPNSRNSWTIVYFTNGAWYYRFIK